MFLVSMSLYTLEYIYYDMILFIVSLCCMNVFSSSKSLFICVTYKKQASSVIFEVEILNSIVFCREMLLSPIFLSLILILV